MLLVTTCGSRPLADLCLDMPPPSHLIGMQTPRAGVIIAVGCMSGCCYWVATCGRSIMSPDHWTEGVVVRVALASGQMWPWLSMKNHGVRPGLSTIVKLVCFDILDSSRASVIRNRSSAGIRIKLSYRVPEPFPLPKSPRAGTKHVLQEAREVLDPKPAANFTRAPPTKELFALDAHVFCQTSNAQSEVAN